MSRTLSESASKEMLAEVGVPFLDEAIVKTAQDATSAADQMGYPVVLKLNGDAIAHKTERGLVRLNVTDHDAVLSAAQNLLDLATPADGEVSVLVAPFVKSNREFICGTATDPQFGPIVLFGVGGILAEAVADVSIALAPLTESDAFDMIDSLATQTLLEPFRGEPAVDRRLLAELLVALSAAAQQDDVSSIDLNPVLIVDGKPVAVDALVEVKQ